MNQVHSGFLLALVTYSDIGPTRDNNLELTVTELPSINKAIVSLIGRFMFHILYFI
jgi:hypothetical protein